MRVVLETVKEQTPARWSRVDDCAAGAFERAYNPSGGKSKSVRMPGWRSVRSCASWPKRNPGESRSEEHTSELQSLMRISYAVFCLKKKQGTATQTTTRNS